MRSAVLILSILPASAALIRAMAPARSAIKCNAAAYLAEVPQGPPDVILGFAQAFRESEAPGKINLVVGAYRDAEGKPWVLPSVRAAEYRLIEQGANKEYAAIAGVPQFLDKALAFAYGDDCKPLKEGRIVGVQTLSGTGACRIAGDFYAKFLPEGTAIYVSDPTWGNHIPIMGNAGLEVRKYRYLDRATNGLNYEGMLEDIAAAPKGSIFLVHACAHNPTGVDPNEEQWKAISAALLKGGHHVLVDMAYQGFATGDARRDAGALQALVKDGHSLILAQSFAKNFGLYGERVGSLSVVCKDADEAVRVKSQLQLLIRPMYSSPPIHGALLVSEVLSDAALSEQYYAECAQMAERIGTMRKLLREKLDALGSTHNWSHITNQIGMFAFTGMTPEMCDQLTEEHAIFLTRDGRISLAGINPSNVDKVASAMHDVTKGRDLIQG